MLNLQTYTDADPISHSPTFSNTKALRSGISALDIRADGRSRRASSLAPGPDTPVAATPFRDILHGSETGRRFSWRSTAALLQAHARRFSSSSAADRASERQLLDDSPEPESSEAQLHLQHADSGISTALDYADVLLEPSTRLHQAEGLTKDLHKSAQGCTSSERLTPQSVISDFHGRSIRTTPSEAGDHHEQDLAANQGGSPQRLPRTSAEYAAQFAAAAANLAADQQSLVRGCLSQSVYRDAPRGSRAQRHVKRSLSTVQPRPQMLTSQQAFPAPQALQDCSNHGFRDCRPPSLSSPSLAAKRKSFQRMVPHRPAIAFQTGLSASGSEPTEGQHQPAPLPSNELARQEALDSLNVMDNPPAAALHDVAVCAATAFQVPVVVITLIGDSTVWCQVSPIPYRNLHWAFVKCICCLGEASLLQGTSRNGAVACCIACHPSWQCSSAAASA